MMLVVMSLFFCLQSVKKSIDHTVFSINSTLDLKGKKTKCSVNCFVEDLYRLTIPVAVSVSYGIEETNKVTNYCQDMNE